ncbi:sensor histidine kinase [Actinomadura roseirufa]|uniref:sensor histidine kinase n=1 Tax=Actinomadura roseirufa TaxID=2094049 RepID=UPI00104198ED|nr:sensor histidine kinase [Actinomadura roseirufa]
MHSGNHRARLGTATGLGALFLTAVTVQALAVATSWGAEYWPPGSAAAASVCVLALLRNRWPRGTTALALAVAAAAVPAARLLHLPGEPGPAMALGLAVLVGFVVRTLPPVTAGAVAGGGLAVAVAGEIAARTSSSGSSVADIELLCWCAAVVTGLSLRLPAARARVTAERVRREERLALAREMHDVVAHHIASMLIQTQAAQVVARRRPEDVPRTLTEIETAGADALAAMRRAVGLLRDPGDAGDAAPLSSGPERLEELVERFGRTGPAVRLHLADEDRDWPPEVAGTVYRVVQESLTNVARHAPLARSVVVTVRRDGAAVAVEVADDAPGAPARARGVAAGGYGLLGMRERVEALGGTLEAGPRDGRGWSVRAALPLPGAGETG